MSDIKPLEVVPPVQEPLKADETPVPVQEVPALETAPVTNETTTETAPAAVEEEKKEEETKPEPKAITEGFLEFKPPGFFHSIIPSKRFFYLGDEAITEQNLEVYRKKDSKGDHAASNAAFASQTGKGLLLFAKTKDQKATPAGIFRLDRATEVVTGTSAGKFTIKFGTNGDIHFESIPAGDRDSWVSTLKAKIEEAKAAAPAVEESEGYKAALEKFAKPTSGSTKVAAAVKETSDKGKEKAEVAKEETKEETEAVKEVKADKKEKVKKEKSEKKDDDSSSSSSSDEDEDKKSKKSEKVKRSASKNKKRTSLFGFGSFKKEKEEKKEVKPEETKVEETKTEEPKAADADLVAAGAAPLATEPVTVADESKPAEEVKPEETKVEEDSKKEEAPKPVKRHSIFSFLDKKEKPASSEKKAEEPKAEDAPKVEETAKEAPAAEPVAVAEPVVAPVEPTPATVEEAKPEETKATPASPPKQSFLDKLFKPKEKTEKATGVAAPKEAAPEIAPEVVATEPTPAAAPATETAPVAEPAPATEAAPVESKEETPAETTATTPKEKRKSSFFGLGKKKESTSDNEEAKSPTSPLPTKLTSFLSRKTSKSVKEDKKEETPAAAAPETVAEESAAPKTEETKKEEAAPAIGDVVPEAVTVGSSNPPVQAAA